MLTAKIKITPKSGVLDPQGKAVMSSLETLGFNGLDSVRLGKYVEIKLNTTDKAEAKKSVESMCQKLLANLVIEQYEFEIV